MFSINLFDESNSPICGSATVTTEISVPRKRDGA